MRMERQERGGDGGDDKELIRSGGDDTVDAVGICGGGGSEGQGGGVDKAYAEDRGGTPEGRGEGQSPQAVGGRARPSVFFNSATNAERGGGGDRQRSAGGKPPDCVKSRRAAATSALAPTVSNLSSLFWDILPLLQLGLVHTFLSEGECGDVAGGVRPDSGIGGLISAEDRREVLGRLGGALYDRYEEIGGQFNMARRIPGDEGFNETIR